ncbi:MAG: serine/threonine-protein kinase [Planctomycetota bacterium]
MQPDRWTAVRELFEHALDLPAADREPFVRDRCGADAGLAAEVLALLRADEVVAVPVLDEGAAAWSRTHDLAGRTIAGFRVLRRIGEGGMGTIYEAEQQRPQRSVALKTLSVRIASERARRRFEDEAEILARLRHPAIAQVIDAGSANLDGQDVPWFAMELVEGPRPIDRFVREEALGARATAALFLTVCEAVHYAHQRGVIHRDLKPGNVLVDRHGQPKVIDFGIARLADDGDRLARTRTSEFLGTLAYMSPERLTGMNQGADTAGDVYALGVVLYELLAHEPPFPVHGLPPARLVEVVQQTTPQPPSRHGRGVPLELDWITMKAMSKEPGRRYRSAGELAQELARFEEGEPLQAGPPSATYRLRQLAWRHRLLLGAAGVLFAAIAIGFVVAAAGWHRVAAAERLASRRADTLTAVNHFQERILRGAYGTEKGGDVRLADVVDAAVADLDRTPIDDPLVESGARNSIGASYLGLGRLQDAERELLQARALLEHHGFDPHLGLMISITSNLGICYGEMGRPELAEAEARRSLADRLAVYAPDGREVALGESNLAMVLLERAAFAEAFDLSTRAHEKFVRHHGAGSEQAINALVAMAAALGGMGRKAEAQVALDDARSLAEQHLHTDHPARLAVLTSVATFEFGAGRFEVAEPTLEEIAAIRERVLGPQHPQTLKAFGNLAACQGQLGRHAAAEATLRHVLAGYAAKGVRDGYDFVVTGQSLNAAVRRQGRAAEAEGMARALLATAERSLPAGHWLTGLVRKELGGCLCDLRRFDEAEPLLLAAHATLTRTLQPNDYRVQRTIHELVALYQAWQRAEDAARWSGLVLKSQ